jgi:hypothetical protein
MTKSIIPIGLIGPGTMGTIGIAAHIDYGALIVPYNKSRTSVSPETSLITEVKISPYENLKDKIFNNPTPKKSKYKAQREANFAARQRKKRRK